MLAPHFPYNNSPDKAKLRFQLRQKLIDFHKLLLACGHIFDYKLIVFKKLLPNDYELSGLLC